AVRMPGGSWTRSLRAERSVPAMASALSALGAGALGALLGPGFSAAGGPASLLAPSLGGRPKAADPSPGAGGASVARPSIAAPAPFAGASLANVLAALPVLAGELVPPSPQPHRQADKPTRTRYRPQSRMTGSFPSALKKGCRGQVSRG